MFPAEYSLRKYIHYLPNQQSVGCCTSSSVLLSAEMLLASKEQRIHFSRLYLYYMTRKTHGRIGRYGAELKHTLDELKNGVCTDSRWSFSLSNVDREPNITAIREAGNYKLHSYDSITVDQYKEYLNKDISIIMGIATGRKFWSLTGLLEDQRYVPINDVENRFSRGHAITCIGYNDNMNGGSWIIANSLGPNWGFYGYGAIPYSCNENIGESYVINNFAGNTPEKKNS